MLLAPLLLTTGASIGATLRVPQDYSTIQAAIESASPGDEVVISPGTYEGGVFVDKDLTLRGESEITLAGGFVPSEDQIDLKALYGLLALNPRLSFTVRVCILVNGAHVILENLAIERADIGLLATEEAEVSCRKLAAAASYWDVVGQGNARLALEGCEFGPAIGAGLSLSDSAVAELASCTFQVEPSLGPTGTGLEVLLDPELYPAAVFLKDSARVRLEGYELSGGGTGVWAEKAEDVCLAGCTISGFSRGVYLDGGSLLATDTSFFGSGTSLFLDAHAGAVCRDCTFAPSGTAVVLGPGATFEGEGCAFRGGAGPAIRTAALKGFELTLRGSRIEDVQGDALYLMSTGSANLEECSIQGNAGAGIRLGAGAELSLTGCTIAGNRWGILIEAKSCELAVYKRTFTGAISEGGNEISGNTEADLCPVYPGPPWPVDFLTNN